MLFTILGTLVLLTTALPLVKLFIQTNQLPKFFTKISWKTSLGLLIISTILFTIPHSWLYVRQGHQYYVVSPFGSVTCYYDAGLKFIIPGSRVQEWEKFIDIKTVKKGESIEGIEGVISEKSNYTAKDLETGKAMSHTMWGVQARFNDQVRGNVMVSTRIQLPQNDIDFIALVEEFRHPKNLVNTTLIPTVKEQIVNTGYMYSAENYVSGEASNFRQTLDDALKYGGFVVDRFEKPDTIFSEIENDDRKIKEIRSIIKVRKRLDKDGNPIRTEHDITKNKLIVSQVIVDRVNLEPKFQQKLEKQRDISAQKSIEIQLTETAQMEQQRIIAQGERDKAAERVKQEKSQVQELIAIETKLKKEETNKKLAQIQLETERLAAQKVKVAADAKRYELINADGLSEEVKFIEQQKTKRTLAVAVAIENAKFPSTVVSGSGGNNGNGLLETLIGAELAKQMMPKK